MFDISFWELAAVGVVTLLVVGPERLPMLVRDAGRLIRKLRRLVVETQYDLEREFRFEEERKLLKSEKQGVSGAIDELDELIKIAPDREPGEPKAGPSQDGPGT
jgi:sec-independent protein translocase protein TatB